MVSKVHKRTAIYRRKLQLLRSIIYSPSHSKTSVILDATEYIQGLKQKLEELKQLPVPTTQSIVDYNPMPKLKVETQEEGFVIKVHSERSCQGLLVFILEAFEELGLEVPHARVSCVDDFCLEAIGNKENNEDTSPLSAQLVEEVVSQAIQNWCKLQNIND
ncbi:transcription factor bHLH61-like [Trifolium pratense]|uniref:transcription factor bHLH61-like n=1 Tax=Trifolium pratense TaxID=57577 RepID=UPI001E695D16|nr:transcription factor bHLH61-like [Trifolium pratense]